MKRKHWVGLAIVVGLLIIYITGRQMIGPVGKNSNSADDGSLQVDGKKLTTTGTDASESSVSSETVSGSAASSSVPQSHATTEAHTESSAVSSSPSSPSSLSTSSTTIQSPSGLPATAAATGATTASVGASVGVDAGSTQPQVKKDTQMSPQGSGADAASKSSSSSGRVDQVTPVVAATKVKPSFPGIVQADDAIMVSDIRHKPGEGEDAITVALSRVEGQGDVDGVIWVIGEYVQRGTTGVMYMPSHNELKVAADGQPKFPHNGTKFQMRLAVEKKFVVKRPGFEGEELVGVRVGVVDKSSGKIHIAKISMKQIQKRTAVKRAKVTDQ